MLTVEDETLKEPCALVLGMFDGLHLGHRALLAQAKRYGLPIALTTILGGKEGMLFTREERRYLFERAGANFLWEIEFSQEVKDTGAEEFCGRLFKKFSPQVVLCGEDFRFGRGAGGDAALLRELAPCPVEVVPAVFSEGLKKISTSACKEHLKRGELALLNSLLKAEDFFEGAYFLMGKVEHGREVGRTYGFPTLNIAPPPQKLLPPEGVYGGYVATNEGNFRAIVNFGACPTFSVAERKVEAHLIGFEGDLYGAEVRIYPTEFLRPIQRFSSAQALKMQLQRDKERICK